MNTHIDNFRLSDKYKILFIIFLSLGIYYPSIFSGINLVDDAEMISKLMRMDHFDLRGVFFPESSIKYYRPLLYLTFIMDRFIWLCDESFMHLENVILHTINCVTVFFIVKNLIEKFGIKEIMYIPLLVSISFVVFPLNTEAVNWISGRTDLMAGMFIFLSFYLFVTKGLNHYGWCCISAFFYLLALLSKEIAIGLLPAIVLFLYFENRYLKDKGIVSERRSVLIIPFLIVTILYIILRLNASKFNDVGMNVLIEASGSSTMLMKFSGLVKAFGFYVKKLFIPMPLNFAIVEINGRFYFWFGLLVLLISLYFFYRRKDIYIFLFFASICFFLPALPIAISKMAWTPLAERYLYVSGPWILTLLIILLLKFSSKKWFSYSLVLLILVIYAFITVERNIIWQDNLTLFADTVKKSPNFPPARNEYGVALAEAGKDKEAIEQFELAVNLSGGRCWTAKLNIIEHKLVSEDTLDEAKHSYISLLKHNNIPKDIILKRIISIIDAKLIKEKDHKKLKSLVNEEIIYLERLVSIEKDGFYSYRLGQLYLTIGNREKAKENFRKAADSNEKAYYAIAAKKLIEKI